MRTVSKFRLSCLSVMFFHLNYYQAITRFLLQFGMVSTWKFFKCSGSCDFVVFEKIYSCLLTPKCTRNHVITYKNMSVKLQHEYKLKERARCQNLCQFWLSVILFFRKLSISNNMISRPKMNIKGCLIIIDHDHDIGLLLT